LGCGKAGHAEAHEQRERNKEQTHSAQETFSKHVNLLLSKLGQTTIHLIENQGDLTVAKILPGWLEWLRIRLNLLEMRWQAWYLIAYWSLPVRDQAEAVRD
jgi:hypothetical protein